LFEKFKNIDFAELCITSSATVTKGDKEIEVETKKASGSKCSLCWKISSKPCSRQNCSLNG